MLFIHNNANDYNYTQTPEGGKLSYLVMLPFMKHALTKLAEFTGL